MNISYRLMRSCLALSAACMLLSCGGGGSDDDRDTNNASDAVINANSAVPDNVFTAVLSGQQETPPSGSNATAIGIAMIDPASRLMRVTLTTAGIAGTSAQIQLAQTGIERPGVFPLTESPVGSGIWSVQTTLTAEQLTSLRAGSYYFDVASTRFPEGELRGRIVPQLPASGTPSAATTSISSVRNEGFSNGTSGVAVQQGITGSSTTGTSISPGGLDTSGSTNAVPASGSRERLSFVNVLSGTQQVPPNGSSAIAIGVAILDETSRTITASITSLGISGLGAHVHRAPAGATGELDFALNETSAGSGIWAARLSVTQSELDAFAGGNRYFDIHTAAFPDGEVRGQIVATRGTGGFEIGTKTGDPANTSGISTGAASPFVPDSDTANASNTTTESGTATVPSLGNPAGSGVGSGPSSTADASVPSFGNPIGSGIGADTADTGFTITQPAAGGGTSMGGATAAAI